MPRPCRGRGDVAEQGAASVLLRRELTGFALERGGAVIEARGLDMPLVPTPFSGREPRAMIERTTVLFAVPGFRVLNVTLDPDRGR